MENNLEEQLSQLQLSQSDLRKVLWYTRWRVFRHHIGKLRPVQILFPVTLSQIGVFLLAILNQDYFLPTLSTGNFIILGLALVPATLQQPKPKIHWVE